MASQEAAPQDGTMVDHIVQVFFQYSQQFIEALGEVWPECPELKRYKLKFDMACVHTPQSLALDNKRKAVARYHATMSPHYVRCTQKDDKLMADRELQQTVDILNDLKFYEKWVPDLHAETKENVWEYIIHMNQYANLYSVYSKVPTGMLGKIETMATGIAGKMESGEMNMRDLNIQQLGHTVMQNLDKSDLDSFASSMMGNVQDVNGMYSMLGSMLSSMPTPPGGGSS
jgi:hypothetical protein